MILHFVKISGLLRFSKTYYGKCPSKMKKYTNLFGVGGSKQISKKNRGLVGGFKFEKCSKFQKVKIICFKDIPIYFLIFLRYFCIMKAINTGSAGPEMTNNRSKI